MLELCKRLNIESTGRDYRHLAANFDMSIGDIHLIAQKRDPTEEVLQRVGQNPQNTVATLRETLVKMERDDCVEIIDEKYKCEVCLVYEFPVSNEYLLIIT